MPLDRAMHLVTTAKTDVSMHVFSILAGAYLKCGHVAWSVFMCRATESFDKIPKKSLVDGQGFRALF